MNDPVGVTLLVVAGLAVGSFLNVCIYRLPRRESVIWPRSHCPSCGRALRWFENLPVASYLVLGGRCRTCRAQVSLVYPLVEVVTPVLFVAQFWQLGWQPLLVVRLVFCSAMIVLLVIDLQHRILPNAITVPGIGVGLLASLFVEPGWREALIGIVLGGGGLFVLAEAYYRIRGEEGLGMGDVKMLAMIGAFLGWPLMLVTLFLGSVLGSAVGIVMLALGLADSKYALPLGSFLAIGAVVAAVYGDPILAWYLSRS